MNARAGLSALRWLVRDTFRQSQASGIFWIMLAFSAICMVFCLSVSVDGGDNLRPDNDFFYSPTTGKLVSAPTQDFGSLRLLFGALKVSLPRDRESAPSSSTRRALRSVVSRTICIIRYRARFISIRFRASPT